MGRLIASVLIMVWLDSSRSRRGIPQAQETVMNAEETRAVAFRFYNEVVNSRDAAAAGELIADDIEFTDPTAPGGQLHGRADVGQFIATLLNAFPDFHMTVEDGVIVEGDRAVARWVARGTHAGSFAGENPSGRTVTVQGVDVFIVSAGQIQKMWVYLDTASLAQQLGLAPIPA
jgi:steroid delta-isomerase-like uncharacterized protein